MPRTEPTLLRDDSLDPLLVPLIEAGSEAEREAIIERLVATVAVPVVETVLRRQSAAQWTLQREDLDDLRNSVALRLVQKLRTLATDRQIVIERFREYVAVLTDHAVHDALRQRFPERNRLKHRIRAIFASDDRLATWPAGPSTLCGLCEWKGRADSAALPTAPIPFDRPADALVAMFHRTGQPAKLDEVVTLFASLWNVREMVVDTELPDVADSAPTQLATLESRRFVEHVWREIQALRPLQRAALLLNLRDTDGGNAAALFILLGVAEFAEIAAAMGMEVERLAEIWGRLPLDDLTIAGMMGFQRQQVINLRRAARERLSRRLGLGPMR